MEHIKERIAHFRDFKEELVRYDMICNKIQTSISLWQEDMETVIEKNQNHFQVKITIIIG